MRYRQQADVSETKYLEESAVLPLVFENSLTDAKIMRMSPIPKFRETRSWV
jgi:hypothetical protein